MSERTFHVPPSALRGETVVLEGDELNHARRTLRLKAGDEVRLVDGEGRSCRAVLTSVAPRRAELSVLSGEAEPPPRLSLTVAMGIVPGERFEWAIQKCTELGASAIVPLLTRRTEARIRGRWSRAERLRRVIVAACKQCGRARFPTLSEPLPLADLDPSPYDLAVYFWESAPSAPIARAARPRSVLMVIGPVGGLTEEEAANLSSRGFSVAGLGPRVLRTETAAAAGAAILQFLFGDLSGGSDTEVQP